MLNPNIMLNYGYYIYKNERILCKRELHSKIKINRDNRPDVKFILNDDIFSNIDCKIDPPFTLSQLYKLRATELRENYDYLILMYSGGSDSHQILSTFLNEGIFLDEIRTFFPIKLAERFTPNLDETNPLGVLSEYKLTVQPSLKYAKNKSPNTKIVEIDITDQLRIDGLDWYKGLADNAVYVTKYLYHNSKNVYTVHKNQESSDKLNKRIGIMFGSDKTYIDYDNDTFDVFFKFIDANRSQIVNYLMYDDLLYTPEMFYYSRTNPLISIKQAHSLLKYCKVNKRFRYNLLNRIPYQEVGSNLKQIKSILYPDWDNNRYQKFEKGNYGDAIFSEYFNMPIEDIIKERDAYYRQEYALDGKTMYHTKKHYIGNLYA